MVRWSLKYPICVVHIYYGVHNYMGTLRITSNYTHMSRHNKFLEQHGCLATLILVILIVVIVVGIHYWVHHGYPIMMPYLKSSGICK